MNNDLRQSHEAARNKLTEVIALVVSQISAAEVLPGADIINGFRNVWFTDITVLRYWPAAMKRHDPGTAL